jgi:hypothetical protein
MEKPVAQLSDPTSSVKETKQSINSAAEQAQDAVTELGRQVSAVSAVVNKSLKDQPITTLAMVSILGFVIGAIWKR